MPSALIDISGLTVQYRPKAGNSVIALDSVSLRVSPGEVVGILGESGSGKSTLVAAIMQLLPETAEWRGSILFRERDLARMKERELGKIRGRHISTVPQDPASALNPVLRISAQISEVLRAHLELSRNERKGRVLELLHEVGFDGPERIACSYPHQLSGGQRQRVVIAQAIACQPELIIADEPISKLDPPLQVQVLDLVANIVRRHNTALLWITHDPASLAGFADRIIVMREGRIVEEGKTPDVLTRPGDSYTQMLMRLSRELVLGLPGDPRQTCHAN